MNSRERVAAGLLVLTLVVCGLGWDAALMVPTVQAQVTSLTRCELNVANFGAKPEDTTFDNGPAFRRALSAAALRGSCIVWVPEQRFTLKSNITVQHGVVLAGMGRGPYDPMFSPAETRQGPTLLVEDRNGEAFITILGSSSGVEDLIIMYPKQIKPNAPGAGTTGPDVYPPTIKALWPTKLRRLYIPNAYEAIHALRGRIYIEDCHLNGYKRGIVVDDALDVVRITDTIISVWHWGLSFPQALDFWVLNNGGTGIAAGRADGLQIDNVLIFGKHTGLLLERSRFWPDEGASGQVSNLNLDTVRNGIIASATEERVGVLFTNLLMGPYWDAPGHAIWLQRPNPVLNTPPRISVVGGSIRHQWAVQPGGADWAFRVDYGELYKTRIIGDDLGPRL